MEKNNKKRKQTSEQEKHIAQLHDQFFLATFLDTKNAADFLRAKLPRVVSEKIDFSYSKNWHLETI